MQNNLIKFTVLGAVVFFLSACAPGMNPVMSLGKDVATTKTPAHESEVYFKEDVATVFSAIKSVSNKNNKTLKDVNEESKKLVISYPFSMMNNVWGGDFNVYVDSVGGRTRMVAQFFEYNLFVSGSILNPLIEDVKAALSNAK